MPSRIGLPSVFAVAGALLFPAVFPAVFLVACSAGGSDGDQGSGAVQGSVTVFAAASLTDAFETIADDFEAENPGVEVRLNLGGSSSLREQILEGAPADVFASADESTMADIVAAGEAASAPVVFARNRLRIMVPAGNPAGVTRLSDFARDELLLGLCAPGVPCGGLARAVLAEAGVEPAPDTEEGDVRALSTKVAAGELDAGLVYATEVQAAGDRVEGIDLPGSGVSETSYPAVVLSEAPNPQGAEAFVDHLRSDAARAVLVELGFTAP